MTPSVHALGDQVGPYRLEALIGEGGMSAVYRAVDATSGQMCALKLMRAEFAGDAAFRERFTREGAYVAGVPHEHIVGVLGSGEHGGSLYLAMEYIEGTDLRKVLQAERRLSAERAVRILSEIAAALDTVHATGLVHRDVKPANILLAASPVEHAYLADFGLTKNPSRDAYALTAAGTFVGTLDYCPPEQILGHDLGPPADVYALACVLFETLTGQAPFAGRREIDVLRAHMEEPPPSAAIAGAPEALDPVIASALAKDPAARPQSCGELMTEAVAALSAVAALVVLEGPATGSRLHLPIDGELVIGRAAGPPGDLGGDHELSRAHARVKTSSSGTTVEDLGSTNGTFVGEHRITTPRTLASGDRISVGTSVLELHQPHRPSRTVSFRVDLDVGGAGSIVHIEPGPGIRVRQTGEGSWTVELE